MMYTWWGIYERIKGGKCKCIDHQGFYLNSKTIGTEQTISKKYIFLLKTLYFFEILCAYIKCVNKPSIFYIYSYKILRAMSCFYDLSDLTL